jgi:peptidoglycan hydrolase-like protein with peptidoglycan-binding domain
MPSLRDAQDARLREEGTIAAPFGKDARGKQVKLVQELLCLHDRKVAPDGDFGDATEAALRAFQAASNLQATGRADQSSVEALLQPLLRAIEPDPNPAANLAAQVVRVAKRHLAEHPLEVGGQNAGPWVRLYTDGREGVNWPWCAGFLSYVVGQACGDLKARPPVKSTLSCDLLATDGQAKGLFVPAGPAVKPEPGWIFLRKRAAGDWDHAGLVAEVNPTVFITVEGNTNDEGSREGFEVCSRARPNGKYDFIRI